MANNKDVEIRVKVDTSDVEKSMKDMEKTAKNTSDKVAKNADKMEKAYGDIEKQLKDITKQTQKAFANMNINGFTNAMNKVKQTATKTMKDVQQTISKALNTTANIRVKATTTTDASNQQQAQNSTNATTGLLAGGAMGNAIQQNLSRTKESAYDVIKAMGKMDDSYKQTIKEAMKFSRQSEALEKAKSEYETLANSIREAGYEIDGFDEAIRVAFQNVKNALREASTDSKESIRKLADTLRNLIVLLSGNGIDNKLVKELERTERYLNRISKIGRDSGRNDSPVKAEEVTKANRAMKILNNSVIETEKAVQRLNSLSDEDKMLKDLGDKARVVKDLKEEYKNATTEAEKFNNTLKNNQTSKSLISMGANADSHLSRVVAWFKRLRKEAKQATTSVKNSSKSMQGSFKSLISSITPILSIVGIFSALKNSITSYTDSLQDSSKFGLVFGSETQNMTEWLNNLNSTVTTSKSTLMDFSSNLFRMSRNMGVAKDDSISMAKSMTELGADLAAFTNDANSIEALASALRGEYDSLQNYGYTLSAASVEAEAMALGLDTASESALLFARQSLILKQSGDVLGYGAMQAKTLGGQLQMLQKNFQALGTAIGSCFAGLLQVILPVLNSIVVAVTNAFNQIANVINSIFGLFGIKVGGGSSSGGGAIGDAISGITDSLGSGLSDASGGASDVADSLGKGAESASSIAKSLLGIDEINNLSSPDSSGGSGSGGSGSGSGGSGGGAGGGLLSGVADSAQEAGDKSKTVFGEIEGWIKDLANAMKLVWNTLKDGWNSVSGYITQSVANLKQAFSNLGTAIKNFLIGAWNNGGKELIYNFGRLAGAIVGCAIDISGQVVQAFADLFNYLNPETNSITKGFLSALNRMLVASQNFALSLGKWFSIFMSSGGQAFLNVLGDIVLLIGTILANVLADGITLVTNFFNSWAGSVVIKTVAITLNVLAGVVKATLIVIDKCRYAIYALILMFGAFKLSKIINDFNTFQLSMIKSKDTVLTFGQKLAFAQVQFGGFKTAMLNTLSSFKDFIVNGLKSAIQFTINLAKQTGQLVLQMGKLAIQLASSALKGMANIFLHPIQTVKTLASTIATCTVNMIKFGASMLTNAVKGLVGLATQCYAGVASLLGLSVAEGTATAGAVALQIALSALGIGLIVGAIVGLIAVIKNWSTITAKISDLWKKFMNFLGEKCPWLKGIFEALGNVFSWIGEKVGWLWDKVKGFFGWSGSNNPTEMAEDTDLAMEGLGDTVEETSDRFGSACSAINQSLASLEIDSTRLALSLDEAESTFNEKFDRMSSNAKDYLQAIADGNQDSLDQMGVDTEAALEELRYTWEQSSEEEKAIMYAKYGEINGITDSWMNYTGLSYDQMVLRHASYIENVNKNEKLSVQEKDRLINEANNNFRTSLDTQLADLKKQLAEVDKLEGISNSDRIAMKQELRDKISSIEEGMTKNSTDSIKTVEDATKASTEVQKDAYSTVGEAQAGSLQEVSTNLEDTKAELDAFSKHSKTIAEEIPTHWKEIGKTISTEFTKAKQDVIKAFNDMNTSVKNQVTLLKTNLSSAFKGITTDAKLSTTNMATAVKNAFQSMSNAVKQQLNALTVSVKNSFQSMSTNIKSQLNSLSSSIKSSFNNIANTINSAFSNISSRLVSTLNTMKSQVSSAMNSLKSTFSSSLDSIKSTTQTKIQQICTTMVNKINQSKTFISNAFNNIGTGIGNSLNNLNNQVKNKMNAVVASVQDGVRRMKNATNFNFPTPYMKMPHIKVTGNWDFEKKKVPSFSVNWWSSGAIFNKRTILGNMGVGDAQNGFGNNPEAVLPLDALWSEMDKQFAKQTAILANKQQPINVELTVDLDGRKIAKNTYRNIREMQRLGQIQF